MRPCQIILIYFHCRNPSEGFSVNISSTIILIHSGNLSRSLCRFLSSIRHLFSRVSLQWGEKNGGQNMLKTFKNHLRLDLDRRPHLNLHRESLSISWSNKALQKSHLPLNHGIWLWYHVKINWERESSNSFPSFLFLLIESLLYKPE